MLLSTGTHLGPYTILAPLGAGGMGEVYRARDTRLGRDIALKVLSPALANDADYMARFQREAQVLASLNHPNIATIYGVEYGIEEADGVRALAMELVEGPTLEEHIRHGPLALNEALGIAKQIAEALEAAHEKSIVHRDLKPANVKGTPGAVKVLDFGLAKTADANTTARDAANLPTLTMRTTQAGMIMGTAGYMAPEQAAGKPVDKRADIWSFGVVLWEMLTGAPLFEGETLSHTLAHVLTATIDFSRLPTATPPAIRDLLRRCLDRDVKTRLRDIGEARVSLQKYLAGPAEEPAIGRAPHRPWSATTTLAWSVAGLAMAIAAFLAFVLLREKPPDSPGQVRFQIPPPEKSNFFNSAYVSPDGRRIAFTARGQDGRTQVWIHSLDSLESRPVAGTDGVSGAPFWSPDSRFLAFEVSSKLKKVEASGGPPQTLCDLPAPLTGGGWSRDGVIIFGVINQGLMRISEAGGPTSPVTKLDSSRQEVTHLYPSILPDGRHFVYSRVSTAAEKSGIYLGSMDAKPEQPDSKRLMATDSIFTYAPSLDPDLGHILFIREGSLMAQAFDARRLDLAGETVPITDLPGPGRSMFSASMTGVLAYRGGLGIRITQLIWFDRAGKILGTVGDSGQYNTVALSPDGTRVAVSRIDPHAAGRGPSGRAAGNSDIWLHEFSGDRSARLTFDPDFDWMPVWSPDGSRIIFASDRDGLSDLYQKVSSGGGNEETLLKSNDPKYPYDCSQDGRFLLYAVPDPKYALWVLPLTGADHKPIPYLQTESNQSQARFSADSRWVAYTSDESGQNEVYVRPFPAASSGKWMVSKGGGSQPRWRRDGKELFYISADSKLVSVEVVAALGIFQVGTPKALFAAPIWGATINVTRYDVTADGKKFLIISLPPETTSASSPPITVVLNWQAGLKK